MDEFRKHMYEAEQRTFDRMNANARHNELIDAQSKLIDSTIKVADEVHGVRDSLQTQIDDNRITEEKHDKRSKHEFRLSFSVALFSAAIALAALFISIFK